LTHTLLSRAPLPAKYRRNEGSALLPNTMGAQTCKNRPSPLLLSKSSLSPENGWPAPHPQAPSPAPSRRRWVLRLGQLTRVEIVLSGIQLLVGWGGVRWGRREGVSLQTAQARDPVLGPSEGAGWGGYDVQEQTGQGIKVTWGLHLPALALKTKGMWQVPRLPRHCPQRDIHRAHKVPRASFDPSLPHPRESQSPAKGGAPEPAPLLAPFW